MFGWPLPSTDGHNEAVRERVAADLEGRGPADPRGVRRLNDPIDAGDVLGPVPAKGVEQIVVPDERLARVAHRQKPAVARVRVPFDADAEVVRLTRGDPSEDFSVGEVLEERPAESVAGVEARPEPFGWFEGLVQERHGRDVGPAVPGVLLGDNGELVDLCEPVFETLHRALLREGNPGDSPLLRRRLLRPMPR